MVDHDAFIVPPNPPVETESITLFDRIGGRPGLSRLIKWFYARVRYDVELDNIFREHVHHWPSHIESLIDFWQRMTGGPSGYSGNPRAAHRPLALEPRHFEAWLCWWERNCREVSASAGSGGNDSARPSSRRPNAAAGVLKDLDWSQPVKRRHVTKF